MPSSSSSRTAGSKKRARERDGDSYSSDDSSATASASSSGRGGRGRADDDERDHPAGTIERIELFNFMIHEHWELRPSPGVNVITGRNGSGKSAILTALKVAFGATARETDRSTNFRGLIRGGGESPNGPQEAKVVVVLSNRGDDAFEPRVFGERIVVEKVLRTNQASLLRLRTGSMKQVPGAAAPQLASILDHFNIQVTNPIALLSQNDARKFLASAKDEDKYELFMSATQQNLVIQEVELIKRHIENARRVIEESEEGLEGLRADRTRAQNELKALSVVEELEQEGMRAQAEFAWATIIETQEAAKKFEEVCVEPRKVLERQRAEIDAVRERRDRARAHADELNAELKELDREARAQVEAREELKADVDTAKRRLREAKVVEREREKDLQDANAALAAAQKGYEDAAKKDAGAAAADAAERAAAAAKEQVAELERRVDEMARTAEEAEESERNLRDAITDLDQQISRAGRVVYAKKQSKAEAEAERASRAQLDPEARRLQRFGSEHIDIAARIKGAKWRSAPIGPVGRHIQIKRGSAESALAIEVGLSTVLSAYIVDNINDERQLKNIFFRLRDEARRRRARFRIPSIVTVDRGVQRYAVGAPGHGCSTVLSCLSIESDAVFNVVVDHASAHQVVLVEQGIDPRELTQMLRSNRTIKRAVYPNGGTAQSLGTTVWFDSGNSEQRAMLLGVEGAAGGPGAAGAAGADDAQADLVGNLAREIQSAESDVAKLREERRALDTRRLALRNEGSQAQRSVVALRREFQTARNELRNAESRAERARFEVSNNRADALLETRDAAAAEVKQCEEELDRARAASEVQRAERDALVEKLSGGGEFSNLRERIEEVSQSIAERDAEIRGLEKTMRAEEHLAEKRSNDIAAAEARAANKRKAAELLIAEAKRANAARPEGEIRSSEDIARHIEEIKAQLEKSARKRESGESVEEIVERCRGTIEAFKKAESGIRNREKLIELFQRMLVARNEKILIIRRFLTRMTRTKFRSLLERRGHAGSIQVDHANRLLKVQIDVDASNRARMMAGDTELRTAKRSKSDRDAGTTDSKSLSGGERSYSTMAMLLSLWEHVETPIFAVDEFDVFQDAVSRRLSAEQLCEFVEAKRDRQFFILTPQDVGIFDGRGYKLWQLEEPVRNAAGGTDTVATAK